MYYAKNKARSRTTNTLPTMTEQSLARETDINVIITRFSQSGRVPGPRTPPMTGDFSNLPTDLRGFIDAGKQINQLRRSLPKELRDIPIQDLLALSPQELQAKLTPPAPPPAPTPPNGGTT